jgi:hypothetical protein
MMNADECENYGFQSRLGHSNLAELSFLPQFVAKCEDECTSEMSGGQFSIFGAVEENLRRWTW